MPERYIEQSARSSHLDVRSDDRLSAADRRPHRLPEHWVDTGTAMLHFACNANIAGRIALTDQGLRGLP